MTSRPNERDPVQSPVRELDPMLMPELKSSYAANQKKIQTSNEV